MGGFAAKQRRRLERQSLQPPKGYYKDDDDDENKPSSLTKKKRYNGDGSQKGGLQSRNTVTAHKDKHIASPKTKKKVQKPKHLKRKLESIVSNSGESSNINHEKEQLLKQMEELERRKRQKHNTDMVTPVETKSTKVVNGRIKQMVNGKSNTENVVNKKRKRDKTLLGNDLAQLSDRSSMKIDVAVVMNLTSVDVVTTNECEPTLKVISIKNDTVDVIHTKSDNIEKSEARSAVKTDANKNGAAALDDTNKSGDDDDDDDDDNDETLISSKHTRQRGKRLRRRGQNKVDDKSTEIHHDNSINKMDDKLDGEKSITIDSSTALPTDGICTSANVDTTSVRRCIGRKPVTDFVIGQSYSGTVVYVKSFGVFFDIGCHSDAFCHVSQLSDEFIETPIDMFPIGYLIENQIHVIAIDRKKKQLTVSLKQQEKQTTEEPNGTTSSVKDHDAKNDSNFSTDDTKGNHDDATILHPNTFEKIKINEIASESMEDIVHTMSPSEQAKRTRKLARRAQRRSEREPSE
jgi:predicted RNA-binding protein with RPS1 domain